jgi:hypothetical protein
MLDSDDMDNGVLLGQAIDDPVSTSASREVTGQLAAERFADPTRVVTERSVAELPYSKSHRHR